MSEIKYFEDQNIKVTSVRVALKNKNYPLTDIMWIAMGEKSADRSLGITLLVFGLVVAAVSIIPLSGGQPVGVVPLMVGLVLVTAGIAAVSSARPRYALTIGTGGSQVEALVSEDKAYISKILNATKQASPRS